MSNIRWEATVHYRQSLGRFIDVTHDLEELSDLHNLIESGPHWDTIINISIDRVNHNESKTLTLEEAAEL